MVSQPGGQHQRQPFILCIILLSPGERGMLGEFSFSVFVELQLLLPPSCPQPRLCSRSDYFMPIICTIFSIGLHVSCLLLEISHSKCLYLVPGLSGLMRHGGDEREASAAGMLWNFVVPGSFIGTTIWHSPKNKANNECLQSRGMKRAWVLRG